MARVDDLIIGGGLAGTTIAVHLWSRGKDFLLLEGASRLGGKIETKITREALFEFGPNSFSNQSEAIFRLLKLLDLSGEILEASPAAQSRFILKKGKVVPLPSKPQEILTTPSLSLKGRLRFLSEFFYVPKKKIDEESVRDFFTRHFGQEVFETFADPFVSGIYAGDASSLSLSQAFPTMAAAEAHSRSLIRHLVFQRKSQKATPKIYQLQRGLESLFHRTREKIGDNQIHLNEEVLEIIPEKNGMRVITKREEYEAKRIYLTSPAYGSAFILKKHFLETSMALSQIDYAPVVSAHFRIPRDDGIPEKGFGILLPSLEKRKILGVLWNSISFPSLFPDSRHHYLTVYAGGVRHRQLVEADEFTLREDIIQELKSLYSFSNEPTFLQMRRHSRAIPQYVLGYGKILKSIDNSLSPYPFLKLAGNYLGGISIPKTVATAEKVINDDFR